MKSTEKLKNMEMKKLIFIMSLPAMVSMLVQALYNIVDSMFVAQISEEALAALTLAFPLQMVIIALFAGLGVGINATISRKLGENKKNDAINTAEHGIMIGIVIWLILAVLSFILPNVFLKLFTDNTVIINYASQYLQIIMLFSVGSIITEICMSIVRATGNPIASMKIQLLGAITNIILDPILIFSLALGIKGAALATIIGQFSSMALGLYMVKKSGINLNIKKFHFDKTIVKNIFRIGIPATLMIGLGSIMISGINFILSRISESAIAAYGAYFRLQSIIMMPIIGLTQGIMPIISYNFGAKNKVRINEAIKYSLVTVIVLMILGTIVFSLNASFLLDIFNASDEMKRIGIICIRICSLALVFMGINGIFGTLFQAVNKPHYSLFIAFSRQIIIILPLAFILSSIIGITGVWISFLIAELICTTAALIIFIKLKNKNYNIARD